jgi:putative sterol carrier protein
VPTFASVEWLDAYKDAINASAEVAEFAKDWERDIVIVVEAEPDKGVPVDLWALFDIDHGKVREARIVTPEEGDRATYVISAPYTQWKHVVQGRVDPIKGMLQGKLKVRGDVHTLAQEVKATEALVKAARGITSGFPDD